MKVITTNRLNRFWKNGVKPIKDALANKLNTANVVNNLLTTAAGYALDARQGKTLDDKITALNGNLKKQYVQSGKATTQNINGYYRKADITFTKAYKSVPIIVATPILTTSDSTSARINCTIFNPSKTGCSIYLADQGGSIGSTDYVVQWIANGEID